MVGGSDYDRTVFNRTVQACRQPGSTYKPIYYALGLDQGYGFDTVLEDMPIEIVDPVQVMNVLGLSEIVCPCA